MNVYGQLKEKVDFPDYLEVVGKMWFKEKDGKGVEFSHVWDEDVFRFSVSLDQWLNGDQWKYINAELDREWISSSICKIKNFDEIQFRTHHVNVLTVNKRAFYILIIERMKMVKGLLSEDDRQTWITVDEFKKRHQDVLSLSYEEANEMSLEEIKTMEAINERPADWDNEEEDKNREEFFKDYVDDEDDEEEE